jgi:hypothetical protein
MLDGTFIIVVFAEMLGGAAIAGVVLWFMGRRG